VQREQWTNFNKFNSITYQREVCPDTGRLHYQVYCQLKRKSKHTAFRKLLSLPADSYHAEIARGTPEEGRKYCSKLESRAEGFEPVILGELSHQGQRNDLSMVVEAAKAGATKRQIAELYPATYMRYHRGIASWLDVTNKQRDRSYSNIVWLIEGDAGSGKTTKAISELEQRFGDRWYKKDSSTKWWDGYDGEPGVLIDDYNGAWPIEYLLAVLHEHPEKVEVKGGYINLKAKFIIITSNKHYAEWYLTADLKHKSALARRITRHTTMEGVYVKREHVIPDNVIEITSDDEL